MKTRQVMHFCEYGKEYSVVRRMGCEDCNPYRIYHHYRDFSPDGYLHNHKKQVAAYADLASCFHWFLQNNIV